MFKIKSTEIIEKICELKKEDINNFYTNYFLTSLDEEVLGFKNDGAIMFAKPEFDFYRLYFAANDLEQLKLLFLELPKNLQIYLEYISNKEIDSVLVDTIEQCFKKEAIYQKMYKKLEKRDSDLRDLSNKVCVDEIYNKMYDTFNIYFDHLPSVEQVKKWNQNDNIITIVEDNLLKSFIIYKITGKQAYLNHIANYGSKENLIGLWAKFYSTLNAKGVSLISLWYNKTNNKALNMYTIEKFTHQNQFNFIYKLNS